MSRFNPHFPNAAEVFDAADKFKQRCLLDQSSLFLDGQALWMSDAKTARTGAVGAVPQRRGPMSIGFGCGVTPFA